MRFADDDTAIAGYCLYSAATYFAKKGESLEDLRAFQASREDRSALRPGTDWENKNPGGGICAGA